MYNFDPYLARDPNGTLFQQAPTQFVDDTYVFCRTLSGAQNAINLLQTAEPLLNIRINPAKTRHFSLQWSPPTSNKQPYYTLADPLPSLSAYTSTGALITIDPIPLNQPTRVLGAHIAPDLTTNYMQEARKQIIRIAKTMATKRATASTLWAVMRSSIYPKFTYTLKFTNLSMKDLHYLGAPLRHLLRQRSNASHLPNAILFAGNATTYSLPFIDLMTHTVKEKESTMLRMLAGSTISQRTIYSLLARGTRLITDNQSFHDSPQPCPLLPHHLNPQSSHHHCWALALIQYLQAASSNIHSTIPFPLTSATTHVTQTPLHTLLNPLTDTTLTVSDIKDFESSYHIYFLEELFSYPPTPPHSYLPTLLPLFPPHLHPFITRITTENYTNNSITHGVIIMREHLLIHIPPLTQPSYIEGLFPSHQHSLALTRQWSCPRRIRPAPNNLLKIDHHSHHSAELTRIPLSPFITARYLRSGIGYNTTHTLCHYRMLTQCILPRKLLSIPATYTPPTFQYCLHPNIHNAIKRLSNTPNHTLNIYTDGSLKTPATPHTHEPPYPTPIIATSLVFPTSSTPHIPWAQRDAIAIKINFPPQTTANNYTAEILGVAIASTLSPHHQTTHIHTDAQGIITSTNKTTHQFFTPSPFTTPHLPRNYTETGLLYKHIIHNMEHVVLHHIKAHQEDSPHSRRTEHGTGNRLADLIAQNSLDEATLLCPNLQIYEYELNDIILPPPTPALIRIGKHPTTHEYYLHHPNTTAKAFLTKRINDWILHTRPSTTQLSPLPWSDLTWSLRLRPHS